MAEGRMKMISVNGVQIRESRAIVEEVLGKKLPSSVIVHHADCNENNNEKTNLVVCQDKAYHNLLHARIRALDACGNANYRPCQFCKKYDDTSNMRKGNRCWKHVACEKEYSKNRWAFKKLKEAYHAS